MNRLCPVTIADCRNFPGERDSPVENYSSEAPDQLQFVGIGYTPFDPYSPPPLGDGQFVAHDCNGVAFSVATQELADLIAQLNAEFCQDLPYTPRGAQFSNDPQTATCFCADGTSFSYTAPAGMFTGPVPSGTDPQALIDSANARALAYAQQQASSQLTCITPPSGPGGVSHSWCCLGTTLDVGETRYTASTPGPWTFSVTAGALPPGTFLIQNTPNSADIIGVPSSPGTFSFTIQAVRTSAPTVIATFTDTFSVIGISPNSLSSGEVGQSYDQQLVALGATGTCTFSITSGDLPDGLAMDNSGHITGTPTTVETADFEVQVTCGLRSCRVPYIIDVQIPCVADVGPAPTIPIPMTYPAKIALSDWSIRKFSLACPACNPSVLPEWSGRLPIIDETFYPDVSWLTLPSVPLFSVNGLESFYPGVRMNFVSAANAWELRISCVTGGPPSLIWYGIKTVGDTPVGTFMRSDIDVFGAPITVCSPGPQCLHVAQDCSYSVSELGFPAVPALWNGSPQPPRVRIKDYATVLASFGPCSACDPVAAQPPWNGQLPHVYSPNNSTLQYFPVGTVDPPGGVQPPLSIASKIVQNGIEFWSGSHISVSFIAGSSWQINITCFQGGTSNHLLWSGWKPFGLTPVGTYIRFQNPQAASGPSCISIEEY